MAWADELQDASFKGVPFLVRSVSDPEHKALAVSEYPFLDGADVDDMGLHARRRQVKAFLYGPDYMAQLRALLDALRSRGPGVLVHPIFGVINAVNAEQWDIDHDWNKRDSCTLGITFIEGSTSPGVFASTSRTGSVDLVSSSSADAQDQADAALTKRLRQVPPTSLARVASLVRSLAAARTAPQALLALTGNTVTLANLDPVQSPSAWVTDSQSINDTAMRGLAFGGMNDDFSGDSSAIQGTALSDFNQVATVLNPANVVIEADTAEPNAVSDAAVAQAYARAHAACAMADAATFVLQGEIEAISLDRRDIERVVSVLRTALQLAINDARSALDREAGTALADSLAQTAYAAQEAARAIIQLRPPVVTRAAPLSGHLRLVAHALYGDQARAAELQRLNSWGRDVFVTRGQELQAYAR